MSAEFLAGFVRTSAERHGFTCGRVDEDPTRFGWIIRLDDDVVEEHAAIWVSRRDLAYGNRIATMRMLDYQIARARRELVARVTGEVTP
jgi:hypothetical protein